MNKTICPVCHQELTTPIRPDFMICTDCGIAVRLSSTILATPDRLEVYSDEWVRAHSRNLNVQDVAKSLSDIIQEMLGEQATAKILDIGCGSGVLVNKLSRLGYDASGLDWSEPAIKFAREHYQGEYVLANVEQGLDIGKKFDCVVASHILEHLVDPHSFLRSVAKLLKPSGYLVIAIPNLNWHDLDSAWRSASAIFDEEHVVGYTPSGLQIVLNQSGFDVMGMSTETHRAIILTAVGVSVYKHLRKDKGNHQGAVQQAYGGITNNSVVSAILSGMLYPFNRLSEKNLRGMELIAVARKQE